MSAVFISELRAEDLLELAPVLRTYAFMLSKSTDMADDLVQDTMERAWRHRANFQQGSNVRAWLFGILRNRFIDELRKNSRTIADVDGEAAGRLSTPPEQLWRLQYADLLRAIDKLSPAVRDALMLVMGSGLSHEEAAAILCCPLGTLKSRIRRARVQLMAALDAGAPPERA
jgi:RNA polymerase sigma-70 factor (ECF subfamily)